MNNFVALLMGPDLKFHMKMPNIQTFGLTWDLCDLLRTIITL